MPKKINGKTKNIHDGQNTIQRSGYTEPLAYDDLITPPFYGTGEILTWQADVLADAVDKKKLLDQYWHTEKKGPAGDREAMFSSLIQEIQRDSLIDARGYYGFYPVITDDEFLILLNPNDYHTEVAAFQFPRLKEKENRSYADFFRPEGDILPIQVCTLGRQLTDKCTLYAQKNNRKHQFLSKLGIYLLDSITEKLHIEIQRGLCLPRNQGLRHHFGDSGMPEADKNREIIELLCADDRLGITLNDNFQLQPELSSLALFIQHPEVNRYS